jgi:predicted flap endonuclease-1-like 5' DNA nuclease
MSQTSTLLVIFIVLVVAAAFLYIWRRRDEGTDTAPRAPKIETPGRGIADEAASAVENVSNQFLNLPSPGDGPPDELTLMKGVGPRAAAILNDLGIIRFDQIAVLSETQIALVDDKLGTFKGRITRDRWVEQASYLARGDRAGFEAKFGKLGE